MPPTEKPAYPCLLEISLAPNGCVTKIRKHMVAEIIRGDGSPLADRYVVDLRDAADFPKALKDIANAVGASLKAHEAAVERACHTSSEMEHLRGAKTLHEETIARLTQTAEEAKRRADVAEQKIASVASKKVD
jgi:hypothetical protein